MFQSVSGRITKTPLSAGRFLIAGVFVVFMLDIFFQLFSVKDEIDVSISMWLVIGSALIVNLSELVIRHRWIMQTVLVQVDHESDVLVGSSKPTIDKTELVGFVALKLPVVLAVLGVSATIDWIFLLIYAGAGLGVTVLALMIRYFFRKRSQSAKRIILSKVGMIYHTETILWADLRGLVFIETGEVVTSGELNKLVLNIGKTYRYLHTTQTYAIPLRDKTIDEISRILNEILMYSVRK
jgi:hypothetical protein